jgi:CubicO group peptidase (beta-lactamase class C family)
MALEQARLEQLRRRARRDVDDGVLPYCRFAVGHEGELVADESFGSAGGARSVVFSCTKAVVAGVVWQLAGEDRLSLDDRVVDHFPEFGENGKDRVTIAQCLSHTSGFARAPMRPSIWTDRAERVRTMAGWRLDSDPGSRFEYHPTSAHWVVREVVERIEGHDLHDSIRARITEPLGMAHFELGVMPDDQGDIAPLVDVGTFPTADEIQAGFGVPNYDLGEVTPEALLAFNQPSHLAVGVPGGGGVGTAADLARYYQALLHDPEGLWRPDVLADGTGHVRNRFPDPLLGYPANRTAGLVVAGDDGKAYMRGMGRTIGPRAFGHNGAGGQIAWADPQSGLSFAYVTTGIDRHFLRESRRVTALASLAALLTTPD